MALNFRSDGQVITYVNLGQSTYWGSADIPSGSIVQDNLLIGVAMSEIVLSGNESGSLAGQRVQDADADFKFESNNVCRVGEWAYDALLAANMDAFSKIYWNSEFNVLVADATSSEFLSSVTSGAPDWTNRGSYGAVTVAANSAVATTEWFQLKKNEFDAYYTLWGSYSGIISEAITASALTAGSGYAIPAKGVYLKFASITTAVGGDRWEFYVIKESGAYNIDIGAMILPYDESKVKHLGQHTFKIPLIQPKTSANTVLAGAYITAKYDVRFRETAPAQGGGKIQIGKLFFQFVN
jgi:hypothetical protein